MIRYCETCDTEFQPEVRVCSDCGGELVDRWPDADEGAQRWATASHADPPPGDYRGFVSVETMERAAFVAQQLVLAGIPYRIVPLGHTRHRVDVDVRREDLVAARAALERVGPAFPSREGPAVGESGGPCPSCGGPVSPGDAECGSCGLCVGSIPAACARCGAEMDGFTCPACGARSA